MGLAVGALSSPRCVGNAETLAGIQDAGVSVLDLGQPSHFVLQTHPLLAAPQVWSNAGHQSFITTPGATTGCTHPPCF